MAINARSKGAAGEREFCHWLKVNLDLDAKRNLEQVREGGTDIIIRPFGFEVKRRESLDLVSWWIQAKSDCHQFNLKQSEIKDWLIPVVAFRQNSKPWEFLISAHNIGCEKGFIRISEKVFIDWVGRFI